MSVEQSLVRKGNPVSYQLYSTEQCILLIDETLAVMRHLMARAEPHAWISMQIGLVKDNSLEQEVP